MRPLLTLRTKATAAAVLFVAVVLTAGAVLLLATLDRRLTASSDQASQARLRELVGQARLGELPAELRQANDDGVAQVVGADGAVLAATPNIAGQGPVVGATQSHDLELVVFRGPDDEDVETYRSWRQSVETPDGEATVVVGSSLEAVAEATHSLRTSLLVGIPLAVAVLGVGIWLVLGRTLGRLDRIRAEVDTIGADELDRRVPVTGPADEVGRLAATMNRMLARVETSVTRQRRFVADVSHDLQSPLATQRLSLELALGTPDRVDVDVLRADVLGATEEMERLVDDLLVLAAADEHAPVVASSLDLDALVLEETARARTGTQVVIDTSRVSGGPVHASATELRRAVRNLVENAVAYADSRVDVGLRTTDGEVVLDVVDDGPGVPEGERALVFDRFHRGDRARTRGAPGTGLGLSIARTLVERSAGRLEVVDDPGGAHFRVVLPVLPVDGGPPDGGMLGP